VAASHLRVGSFQYAANFGSIEVVPELADYTIKRHYPEVEADDNRYLSFLREVIKRQALLNGNWLALFTG